MLRDKKFLTNPIEKVDEQIIIKIGSANVPIKEIEGPIIISNLDQSDQKKTSKVIVATDHEAQNNSSALANSQPTWCPLGLSRAQRHKLQRSWCKKLKQEELAKFGEE